MQCNAYSLRVCPYLTPNSNNSDGQCHRFLLTPPLRRTRRKNGLRASHPISLPDLCMHDSTDRRVRPARPERLSGWVARRERAWVGWVGRTAKSRNETPHGRTHARFWALLVSLLFSSIIINHFDHFVLESSFESESTWIATHAARIISSLASLSLE
ncbi:hypothetical protein BDW22DRAFT_967467 [Trametopsis cervina]|nr:hypothetical protein BDW22DRAFT_967467 [Trametopsis cervina]